MMPDLRAKEERAAMHRESRDLSVSVLVIDDEAAHAEVMSEILERAGCACAVATDGAEGLRLVRESDCDVVVTDLVMHEADGMAILQEAKDLENPPAVIMVTGHGSISSAVEAMRQGAANYLTKPIDGDELRALVRRAAENRRLRQRNTELERQIDERYGFEGIIGNSPRMQRIFDILRQISPTDATVLIRGESGSGKELVAKAIHNNSPRRNRSFVALNCAALSESILESELFGHERGAFTGATTRRKGRFEYAHRGTLFLDEIGDMPMTTQIKLLRVIEQKAITHVGSNVPIQVDVRLVAATHQNLESLIREGRFREDLYYRLNVLRLDVPALRERRGDIPLLVEAFIKEFAGHHRKDVRGITPEARAVLERYTWPGNVRELKNCIESMVIIAKGRFLDVGDITGYLPVDKNATGAPAPEPLLAGRLLEEIEREAIVQTLELTGGNREETAARLGIGERTLYRKLEKYGLR